MQNCNFNLHDVYFDKLIVIFILGLIIYLIDDYVPRFKEFTFIYLMIVCFDVRTIIFFRTKKEFIDEKFL